MDRVERWATLASMPERRSAMAKAVAVWSAINSEQGVVLSKAPAGAHRSHALPRGECVMACTLTVECPEGTAACPASPIRPHAPLPVEDRACCCRLATMRIDADERFARNHPQVAAVPRHAQDLCGGDAISGQPRPRAMCVHHICPPCPDLSVNCALNGSARRARLGRVRRPREVQWACAHGQPAVHARPWRCACLPARSFFRPLRARVPTSVAELAPTVRFSGASTPASSPAPQMARPLRQLQSVGATSAPRDPTLADRVYSAAAPGRAKRRALAAGRRRRRRRREPCAPVLRVASGAGHLRAADAGHQSHDVALRICTHAGCAARHGSPSRPPPPRAAASASAAARRCRAQSPSRGTPRPSARPAPLFRLNMHAYMAPRWKVCACGRVWTPVARQRPTHDIDVHVVCCGICSRAAAGRRAPQRRRSRYAHPAGDTSCRRPRKLKPQERYAQKHLLQLG
jgi:hypothetical protein